MITFFSAAIKMLDVLSRIMDIQHFERVLGQRSVR